MGEKINKFHNFILRLKSFIRWIFLIKTKEINPPENYHLKFIETFSGDFLSNSWEVPKVIEEIHPDFQHQYFSSDKEFYLLTKDGLELHLKHKPKVFDKNNLAEWQVWSFEQTSVVIQTGASIIKSKNSWKYGWFEMEMLLPEGLNYWPAFWLTGDKVWPPEIDIIEAYSGKGSPYKGIIGNNFSFQPNLYWGTKTNVFSLGAKSYPIPDCTKRFVKFILHWEKDFIKIYYDGYLIVMINDNEILKHFNEPMKVVINFSSLKNLSKIKDAKLIVKNLKVFQILN
jgi:hypothetical protein